MVVQIVFLNNVVYVQESVLDMISFTWYDIGHLETADAYKTTWMWSNSLKHDL